MIVPRRQSLAIYLTSWASSPILPFTYVFGKHCKSAAINGRKLTCTGGRESGLFHASRNRSKNIYDCSLTHEERNKDPDHRAVLLCRAVGEKDANKNQNFSNGFSCCAIDIDTTEGLSQMRCRKNCAPQQCGGSSKRKNDTKVSKQIDRVKPVKKVVLLL